MAFLKYTLSAPVALSLLTGIAAGNANIGEHIPWPASVTSTELCRSRVREIVEHYRFSSVLTQPDLLSGDPSVFAMDTTRHFYVSLICDEKRRTVFVMVNGWLGHIGSADDFLKEIKNIFMSPWPVTRVGEFTKATPDCKRIETCGRK